MPFSLSSFNKGECINRGSFFFFLNHFEIDKILSLRPPRVSSNFSYIRYRLSIFNAFFLIFIGIIYQFVMEFVATRYFHLE